VHVAAKLAMCAPTSSAVRALASVAAQQTFAALDARRPLELALSPLRRPARLLVQVVAPALTEHAEEQKDTSAQLDCAAQPLASVVLDQPSVALDARLLLVQLVVRSKRQYGRSLNVYSQ